MTLRIRSTKVVETETTFVVEMIMSSLPNLETSPDVIQLRATIPAEDRYPRFAELQRVALQSVQTAVSAEIHRIELARGQAS